MISIPVLLITDLCQHKDTWLEFLPSVCSSLGRSTWCSRLEDNKRDDTWTLVRGLVVLVAMEVEVMMMKLVMLVVVMLSVVVVSVD